MQHIQFILIVLLALILTLTTEARNFDPLSVTTTNSTRVATGLPRQCPMTYQRRTQREQETRTDGVSIRAKNYVDQQVRDTEAAPWRRIIYRQLSVGSLANTPIFRPVCPSGQLQSLLSLLFRHFNGRSIIICEYEGLGYKNLTPERQLRFKDLLDRFGIVYDKDPGQTGNRTFKILPVNIPTQSIHNYYVKEEYCYDAKASDMSSQIMTICPVMDDEISMKGNVRIPLFWVKCPDMQPYLS